MCDVLWKLRDVDHAWRIRSIQEEVGTDSAPLTRERKDFPCVQSLTGRSMSTA
jgi:hypothetical protein